MSFLAAPLLWGLTAAGVPVLIHLTARAKPMIHLFPAMRFLQRSQRSSSGSLRIKHILILLLRALIVALIAIALARPQWAKFFALPLWLMCGALIAASMAYAFTKREYSAGTLGALMLLALYFSFPRGDTATVALLRGDYVLIIDRSMSMNYAEPGESTRLELARQQATQLLNRLAPESRVALIYATERAERIQGRLTYRVESIREKLKALSGTGRGLNISCALDAASEIVAREARTSSGRHTVIVFFTDLQANAINAILNKSAAAATGETERSKADVVIVNVGTDGARNGAALAAELPGSIIPPDKPVTLSGKVRPVDSGRPCLVELYIDEKKAAQKILDPNETDELNADFIFNAGHPGLHTGRLHLADNDALAMDQDCVFSYESGRPPAALILESPDVANGKKGTAFFLRAALQAGDVDHSLNETGLTFTIENPSELKFSKLSQFKVLILADCGPLSPPTWAEIRDWCADGGGLFVWTGPHTDLAELRKEGFQEFAKYHGLLPGTPIALTAAPADKPLPITLAQSEHPLLAHFNPAVVSMLRDSRVAQYLKVHADARDADTETVLSLGDGSPFLLEKTYGRGRVLLCTIGPGLEYSDLPKRGEAFVTLVLDSLRVLTGRESDSAAKLGFPMALPLPAMPDDKHVQWFKPGSMEPEILTVEAAGTEHHEKNSPVTVIVPPLENAGIHRFSWTQDKQSLVKLVAVNHEPSESDLKMASKETVQGALANWHPAIVTSFDKAQAFGGTGSASGAVMHEFTVVVLISLAALMLLESFISNRLYREEGI